MFIGQYAHQLEAKGRLSVPFKFRSALGDGAILCQGLDTCLFLYPKSTWTSFMAKLQSFSLTQSDARNFTRALTYTASEVNVDKLGRILVPEYLKTYAHITKDCVIAGALERIEIWDSEVFAKYLNHVSSNLAQIAEKLP